MTKNQLVKLLIELDSEYMFRDIGYGGFYGNNKVFTVQGNKIPVSRITKEELQDMLHSYGY